eukprot:s214_g13.t1
MNIARCLISGAFDFFWGWTTASFDVQSLAAVCCGSGLPCALKEPALHPGAPKGHRIAAVINRKHENSFENRIAEGRFGAQFESFVLAPALAHLEALRVAMNELTFNERFQAMQQWVEEIQLPHLGPTFLTDALRAAGANRAPSTAEWILEARAAVANSAWWSCPKAAVSSQGVVAFMSAELQVGAGRVTDPGTVYQADDAPGLVLVERLLQPIYLQVPPL